MLSLLHIENIAVIERADIQFGARLNILPAENGAVKSNHDEAEKGILGRRA